MIHVGSSTVYDLKKQKNQILNFFAESDSKKNCLQRWHQKFKTRHDNSLHHVCDEKRSADTEAASNCIYKFDSLDVNDESEFTGFQVSENQKIVSELMSMPETGWKLTKIHQLLVTNEEIVQMVQQGKTKDNKDSSDGDEDEDEDVAEKNSIDKCIQLTTNVTEGLEQRHFNSEQEIMSLYMIREKLIKEKPKYMRQHFTVKNPVASFSSILMKPFAKLHFKP
uniref:Uncharacterized protein n=1 Tax=Chelonoidis abingdonii TaxID=106734 RepID=A0A8C0GS27_CHEAB